MAKMTIEYYPQVNKNAEQCILVWNLFYGSRLLWHLVLFFIYFCNNGVYLQASD